MEMSEGVKRSNRFGKGNAGQPTVANLDQTGIKHRR